VTPEETVLLTEYVRDSFPHQAIGEYTPDAWFDVLGDLSLSDCKSAVAEVANRQAFLAASDIRAEVKRVRNQRIQDADIPPPPPELLDDPPAYCAAVRAANIAVADGRDPMAAMQAIARTARRELEAG
jgi:hypothetical protein